MATVASFLSRPPSDPLSSLARLTDPSPSLSTSLSLSLSFPRKRRPPPPPVVPLLRPLPFLTPRASSAAASGTQRSPANNAAAPDAAAAPAAADRVQRVHSTEEFDAALVAAKNRLVVVEYAASSSPGSRRIYPFMVELSRTCGDVEFLLVVGDESERTRELCRREGIGRVPHFTFYKAGEKVHEEEGIGPERLEGDVLYYGGDSGSAVVQVHSRGEAEELMAASRGPEGKLVVLDVGLKRCGPCVKVYPTVVRLSRSMAGSVVFARMNGDENESCMGFLRDMGVVEVPTFLFIRDGEICGRYVGSGKGELIGEILRYQGVRVT